MTFAHSKWRSAPGRKLGLVQEKRISPTLTVVFKAGRPNFFSYLQRRFNVKKIVAQTGAIEVNYTGRRADAMDYESSGGDLWVSVLQHRVKTP